MVLSSLLDSDRGKYVDVGCHHPIINNSSYFLYKRGWQGYGIDPNKNFSTAWDLIRPRDKFLPLAAGEVEGTIDICFYENSFRSTASIDLRQHYKSKGRDGLISSVAVIPIKNLLPSALSAREPFVVFIDVEGMEMSVLKGCDFAHQRPRAIVIESYTKPWENTCPITKYLRDKEYQLVAYTGLSGIYFANEWADEKFRDRNDLSDALYG